MKENSGLLISTSQDILLQDSNGFVQKVLDLGGGPQRTARFRFSISRLPMWAQSKVAHSDTTINAAFTSPVVLHD
ncbi:conserved hypothetical protein [Ricinus communis]|uniref:Uncharacterized protein n=1 Tax=Ricinus communis TaxID=3988 RepID=B9T8G1_RICCO|nr:conserved hypothetical protein [Ricinus communis]